MKLEITKVPSGADNLEYRLDGVKFYRGYRLSRKLTHTDTETGWGMCDRVGSNVSSPRVKDTVEVCRSKPLDLSNPHQVMEVLLERVTLVNKAFTELEGNKKNTAIGYFA
jgi:hypothetical protein